MYLSGSAFLVSFADPNKELPNVKSVFKSLGHWFGMWAKYIFINFLGIEILLSIKRCPLKFTSGNK